MYKQYNISYLLLVETLKVLLRQRECMNMQVYTNIIRVCSCYFICKGGMLKITSCVVAKD